MSLLVPTAIGMLIGSFAFRSLVGASVGDPTGSGRAAGFGGLAALAIAICCRRLIAKR